MNRRGLLAGLLATAVVGLTAIPEAEAAKTQFFLFGRRKKVVAVTRRATKRTVARKVVKTKRKVAAVNKTVKSRKVNITKRRRSNYQGAQTVAFFTAERPGTIVIKTKERALYYVLGGGKAVKYGVAVGREGFSWSGTARVGGKAKNPRWTPPPEMIERAPKFAKWAGGMPGGIPQNPLGVRAIYLHNRGGDTGFRIHGTNEPGSIGSAASSGCIRMLNHEVIDLYGKVRMGAKVVVI